MSDFLTSLKYRVEPIMDKFGLGDKPIGRLILYTGVIVVGFAVLLWAIIPSSQPIASNPRIPEAASPVSTEPDAPPPPPTGGARAAPPAGG